jgi:hypothetical protein
VPDNGFKRKENPLHLATLWYNLKQMRRRVLNGKKGVFNGSSVSWKNTNPDGTGVGCFS